MDIAARTDQFVAKYNGKYINEDGAFGSQCWDVVARFAREVVGCPSFPTGSGGAEGLYRLFVQPIPRYFRRIPANELRKGDIAVYSSDFFPPWGHTFLVIDVLADGTIRGLEQDGSNDPNRDGNADGVAYIKIRNRNKLSGGLRALAGEDDMPIPDADNYYFRYNKAMRYIRGRDMSREEFRKNFVGNSDLRMLESMLDSSEADAHVDYANWGKVAKNDKWDEQIRIGLDKVRILENERDTMNYPKINAATAALGLPVDATAEQIGGEITKLKLAGAGNEEALKLIIKDKTDQLQQVEANFVKLAKETDELKKQLAAQSGDTELLNGFGQWLTKLIARLGIKK